MLCYFPQFTGTGMKGDVKNVIFATMVIESLVLQKDNDVEMKIKRYRIKYSVCDEVHGLSRMVYRWSIAEVHGLSQYLRAHMYLMFASLCLLI